MCGVAGIVSLKNDLTRDDMSVVTNMTKLITHRGPSQQGHFEHHRCMLGNARLAIIDPSENSRLPMSNEDGTIWISYNGEVSNFKELKKKHKLEEKYNFKGYSDTEVLVYLYQELGIDFLKELSGMFAFGLLDLRKNKAFIIRDFYGINPMFWMEKNGKMYFASEMKAFHEIPEFNDAINHEAMYHYFTLAYLPGDRTPYKEVHEMREGQYMEIDLETGKHELQYHYELHYEQRYDIGEKEATQKVHDLLLDSIKRNLISDAPLGMTLSGGIDTSTMLALVKELGLSKKMNTFALKMGEGSFDESKYQHLMAKFGETIHHEIVVKPEDVEEVLIEHMAYMDEPIGDGSAIPSYLLAREATKHVDVLFSGEGGDEVFNAYETLAAYQMRKLYRKTTPKPIRQLVKWGIGKLPTNYKKLSFDFKAKRFTEGVELDTPDSHMFWRHVLTDSEKNEMMPNHNHFEDTTNIFRRIFYDYADGYDDDLNRISLIDIKHFFIDDLMVKNDRMFMSHSIETRFPMMDRILVDYVKHLPVSYRVKGFKRRYIQKKAMEGLIPKEVLNRASFGLEMPHSMWFMDKLGPFAEKYLNKKTVERTEFLHWPTVERLWKMHISGKKDYGRAIWCILLYLIWFDLYIYNKSYKQYLTNHLDKVKKTEVLV
jgi:asparagine synthase (glutamine-hydrolysing)